MSIADVKTMIDGMSSDEQFFAAAYLQHLSQIGNAEYRSRLTERLDRMAAGKKVGLELLRHIHETLEGEGL